MAYGLIHRPPHEGFLLVARALFTTNGCQGLKWATILQTTAKPKRGAPVSIPSWGTWGNFAALLQDLYIAVSRLTPLRSLQVLNSVYHKVEPWGVATCHYVACERCSAYKSVVASSQRGSVRLDCTHFMRFPCCSSDFLRRQLYSTIFNVDVCFHLHVPGVLKLVHSGWVWITFVISTVHLDHINERNCEIMLKYGPL